MSGFGGSCFKGGFGGSCFGGGFGGFGLRRLLIFILVIAVIFVFAGGC
ncbi:sporulation protein YjcZ [Laceyella putida]|uniref:Sporulation protein YjcZ n=1 Tax=Laceyella putida TaxID=110101 RepID=A0ABW2RF36_9BACL